MVNVFKCGEENGAELYQIMGGVGTLVAVLSRRGPEQSFIRFDDGEKLDKDLEELTIEEIRSDLPDNESQIKAVSRVLESLGYEGISTKESLEPEARPDGYIRVRHYSTPSRCKRIDKVGYFGGENFFLDQGKVFVEPADWKVLSPMEFRDQYAITFNSNPGTAFIEFDVPKEHLKRQYCSRNGKVEYCLRANDTQGAFAVYRILKSDPKTGKRINQDIEITNRR